MPTYLAGKTAPSALLNLALVLLLATMAPGTAQQVGTDPTLHVTFTAPGSYTLSLQVANGAGTSTVARTITVLDPRPAITSAATDGLLLGAISVHAGELVHLFGNGTGAPPLHYTWQVLALAPLAPTFASFAAAEAWWDTAGILPGVYSATLYLSNDYGPTIGSQTLAITVLPEKPLAFYTLPPCRLYDSRDGHGALISGEAITIPADACGIPAKARAVAANVTVVAANAPGKLNLYPGTYPTPATAESSFGAGATRANGLVVGLSPAGPRTLAARAELNGGGTVHLIVDVSGYFAPTAP